MANIKIRKDEFVDEKGVVRKKDMMTINQIEKYLMGRTFEKTSHFYIGNISLGSQFIMVNIPTHQKILVTKVGNNKLQYKILNIRPVKDFIMIYYDEQFDQLVEQNFNKQTELLKIKFDQRKEFKSNAEERLKGAIGETIYFSYATKRVLMNFLNGLVKVK